MNPLHALRRDATSKSWLVDLPLIALAWWLAFWLRFNLGLPWPYFDHALLTTPIALGGMVLGWVAGIASVLWLWVAANVLVIIAGYLIVVDVHGVIPSRGSPHRAPVCRLVPH